MYKRQPFIWLHSILFRTANSLSNLDELKDNNPLYQNIQDLIDEILTDEELNQELLAEWGQIWQGDQNPEDRDNHRFYADQKLQQEILTDAEKIIITELIGDED